MDPNASQKLRKRRKPLRPKGRYTTPKPSKSRLSESERLEVDKFLRAFTDTHTSAAPTPPTPPAPHTDPMPPTQQKAPTPPTQHAQPTPPGGRSRKNASQTRKTERSPQPPTPPTLHTPPTPQAQQQQQKQQLRKKGNQRYGSTKSNSQV